MLLGGALARASGADNIVVAPDTEGIVGSDTSLALDGAGNPVVAYRDETNNKLKVLHCGNPICTSGNAISSLPFNAADISLAIDHLGNPVIALDIGAPRMLALIHCNDPDCAGSDDSASALAATSRYTSLALDPSGNPVIAFVGYVPDYLNIVHCNDVDCDGNDESIVPLPYFGGQMSLALDHSGNPVLSFSVNPHANYDPDLMVLHCGNPQCSAGNTSALPDDVGAVGEHSSIAVDSAGHPVVSYADESNATLKLLHCDDANCSASNSIVVADPDSPGHWTSIALDASDTPIVSYAGARLRILHCGNPVCSSGNSIVEPDPGIGTGPHSSLRLDSSGNPVVSYFDSFTFDLKILHCGNPSCDEQKPPPAVGGTSYEVLVRGREKASHVTLLVSILVCLAGVGGATIAIRRYAGRA